MKLFLLLIFNAVFIFTSCKCNCDGNTPTLSPQNEKLMPFKNDSIIDFISDQTGIIPFSASRFHGEIKPKDISMDFRKSCICPDDYLVIDGYTERIDTIDFGLRIETDKDGSSIHYFFNSFDFYQFDSTHISRKINDKLLTGLSLKDFSNLSNSVRQIYYKDSLGLVSVVYKNGTTIDLK